MVVVSAVYRRTPSMHNIAREKRLPLYKIELLPYGHYIYRDLKKDTTLTCTDDFVGLRNSSLLNYRTILY